MAPEPVPPYVRAVSSFWSSLPDGLDGLLPIARRLVDARRSTPVVAVYGGALPPLPPPLRSALRAEWHLDVTHDADAPDPLASRAFGLLYAHVRAEQIVLALSARTNLTLAGSTVRVVGDGPLAPAMTTLLRRLGAAVVRSSDDPVERLAARLDGIRVAPVSAAASADEHIAFTVLTGAGHADLAITDVAGVVADASPRPMDATAWPSPRPHVRTTPKGSLVEMPSPLPTEAEAPTAAQRHLADALLAALLVEGGPDDSAGGFAEAVTP